MSLIDTAAEMFKQQLGENGSNIDTDGITSALSDLLGEQNGSLDLGGLISKFQNVDLGALVNGWLGDGANESLSADSLRDLLGGDQVSEFASKLNLDSNSAAETLSKMLPELLDKNSQGGSLKDIASDMLGKLF